MQEPHQAPDTSLVWSPSVEVCAVAFVLFRIKYQHVSNTRLIQSFELTAQSRSTNTRNMSEESPAGTALTGEKQTEDGSQEAQSISQLHQASQSSEFRMSGLEDQERAGSGPFARLNAPVGICGKFKISFEELKVRFYLVK